MATKQSDKPQTKTSDDRETLDAIAINRQMEEGIHVKVFGTENTIVLTSAEVRRLVATPTRAGTLPSNRDIILFMKLCQAKGLNPYVGDAFLIGYDTQQGPKFSCITSHKAMLKRCELADNYEGMESGVIVIDADGEQRNIEGDVYDEDTCKLIGGWARIYQEGRKPVFKTTRLKSYDKDLSQWKSDKPWMICKCAEAKAARAAYPTDLAGMYIEDELQEQTATTEEVETPKSPKSKHVKESTRSRTLIPTDDTTAAQDAADLLTEFSSKLQVCETENAKRDLLKEFGARTQDVDLFNSMVDELERQLEN